MQKISRKQLSLVAVACALVACMVFATYVIAFENIAPTKLSFTPSYRAMTISWDTYQSQLSTATSLYAIYRADDATGANPVRIGVVGGDKTSFTDNFLTPGRSYAYAVVNGQGSDGLDTIKESTLTWSAVQTVPLIGGKDAAGNTQTSPHVGAIATSAARNQKGCNKCHVIHDSAASASNLLKTKQSATEPNASIALSVFYQILLLRSRICNQRFLRLLVTRLKMPRIKQVFWSAQHVMACIKILRAPRARCSQQRLRNSAR